MQRIDTALLLLRLVFGLFLAWHGVNKVRGGMSGTAGWFGSIGMRSPAAQARAAVATEIGGGVLFAAGLLTPLASAAVIATMVVAIVTVHRKVGFFIFLPGGGWEYCASIAAVAAAVSIAGAGTYSLDHAWGILEGAGAGVAGVAIGVVAAILHLSLTWRPPVAAR